MYKLSLAVSAVVFSFSAFTRGVNASESQLPQKLEAIQTLQSLLPSGEYRGTFVELGEAAVPEVSQFCNLSVITLPEGGVAYRLFQRHPQNNYYFVLQNEGKEVLREYVNSFESLRLATEKDASASSLHLQFSAAVLRKVTIYNQNKEAIGQPLLPTMSCYIRSQTR